MILPHQRFLPGDRSYSRGVARMRAVLRHQQTDELSEWNVARRAADGRLSYFKGLVPQRGSGTIEAVAWERESGRSPGYRNRRWRKYEMTLTARDQGIILAA